MKTILFTLSLFISASFFSQKYEIHVYAISSRLCDRVVSEDSCILRPDTVENYLNLIKNIICNDSRQPLVITCCGMNAKVMICELYKEYPNGIFLDFGSGLDRLCTKRESRGFTYSYDYLTNLLKDVLPDDWESENYNIIYEQAKYKMGLHL